MLSPACKTPCLFAAVAFALLALLIAILAVAPLGIADLLGIAACSAAVGVFLTLALLARPAPEARPGLSQADLLTLKSTLCSTLPEDLAPALASRLSNELSASLSAALSAQFDAAEARRRAEIETALAATTPPRTHDSDTLPPPAAGAKTRLGRGLLGLMHAPTALGAAESPAAEPAHRQDEASGPSPQ